MGRCRTTFISGKGGVGKTTIAAALACGLATQKKVLHVDMSHDPSWTRSYKPESVFPGLQSCSLNLQDCLHEYVLRRVKIRALVDVLLGQEKIRQFFETAPGVESIIVLGKIFDVAETDVFDEIVVDAPATGHGVGLFQIAHIAQSLFRMGPIYDQAFQIEKWLKSSAVNVRLVTILEDLPVSETIDYAEKLKETGIHLEEVILNRFPSYLPLSTTPEELGRIRDLKGERFLYEQLVIEELDAIRSHSQRLRREIQSTVAFRRADEGVFPRDANALIDYMSTWTRTHEWAS